MFLLQGSTTSKSPDGVAGKIYTLVLEHSLIEDSDGQEREELTKRFRAIVGPIVILFDTLDSTSAQLIDNSERSVLAILGNLHSVLDVPASQHHPIQLLYPPFRDFLLDQTRLNPQFWIDEKATHKDVFLRCIKLMSEHLKCQDICNLRLPGTLLAELDKSNIEKHIPHHVQYACRHRVDHLLRSNITDSDLNKVRLFLPEKFLY